MWKEIFDIHELRASLGKTQLLLFGQQKEDLDIILDGKKLNERRQNFAGEYKLGRVHGGKFKG